MTEWCLGVCGEHLHSARAVERENDMADAVHSSECGSHDVVTLGREQEVHMRRDGKT